MNLFNYQEKIRRLGVSGTAQVMNDLTTTCPTPNEGVGNSYATQFRLYDTRTTRWFSLDPLKSKFPWSSPYVGMDNNPVWKKDVEGDNAVKVVDDSDPNNKIITVKAVYVVDNMSSYNNDQIDKMNLEINSTLNDENYKVTVGKYQGYSVKFDLSFVPVDDGISMPTTPDNFEFGGYNIGNTLQKGGKDDNRIPPSIRERFELRSVFRNRKLVQEVTAGTTGDKRDIYMNKDFDKQWNMIHEMFHTFFFDRDNDNSSGIGS